MLLRPHQPQMIGPPALHEAEIVGVIDDPGKIRVLVIDADLHMMPAVDDGAVEGGGHGDISRLIFIRPSIPRYNDDTVRFDHVKGNVAIDQKSTQRRAKLASV